MIKSPIELKLFNLKLYKADGDYLYYQGIPEEYKFETLSEFKFYLSSGANVGFEFNGIEYGIEGHNNNFYIWNENETIINSITLEQVLDFKLDGVKIRDLILTATITERIL